MSIPTYLGMGASLLLPRLINQQLATHLLMSGEVFTGDEAVKYGLVLQSHAKVQSNIIKNELMSLRLVICIIM